MPPRKGPPRGLVDIQTLTARSDRRPNHKLYMKMVGLELEKFRLSQERAAIRRRVAKLDASLRALEAEKEALLASIGEKDAPATPRVKEGKLSGGLKLRY